jgi:mRNA export factor
MSFFGGMLSSLATVVPSPEKNIEIANPPTDSISSILFTDYLVVGSWDNNDLGSQFYLFAHCCIKPA